AGCGSHEPRPMGFQFPHHALSLLETGRSSLTVGRPRPSGEIPVGLESYACRVSNLAPASPAACRITRGYGFPSHSAFEARPSRGHVAGGFEPSTQPDTTP